MYPVYFTTNNCATWHSGLGLMGRDFTTIICTPHVFILGKHSNTAYSWFTRLQGKEDL